MQQHMALARQALSDEIGQCLQVFGNAVRRIEIAHRQLQGVKGPGDCRLALNHVLNAHLHLLSTYAVAPQKAPIGQVVGIAPTQFAKPWPVRIAHDRAEQLGLVVGVVAGRWRAGAAQHTQREAHFQRVGVSGKCGHVHRLQVWVFDGGIELGRVLVLGLEAVGNRATHRFLAQRHRCPVCSAVARFPIASEELRIGRVQLALESEDGSGLEGVVFGSHEISP
ncbi:hypothetical protein D9M69_556100 [compost metagenome]